MTEERKKLHSMYNTTVYIDVYAATLLEVTAEGALLKILGYTVTPKLARIGIGSGNVYHAPFLGDLGDEDTKERMSKVLYTKRVRKGGDDHPSGNWFHSLLFPGDLLFVSGNYHITSPDPAGWKPLYEAPAVGFQGEDPYAVGITGNADLSLEEPLNTVQVDNT